jgi:gamma-glutamyltranspeptidase
MFTCSSCDVKVIVHHLWFGKRLHEATDVPRLHQQLAPNVVYYDKHFDEVNKNVLEIQGRPTCVTACLKQVPAKH